MSILFTHFKLWVAVQLRVGENLNLKNLVVIKWLSPEETFIGMCV